MEATRLERGTRAKEKSWFQGGKHFLRLRPHPDRADRDRPRSYDKCRSEGTGHGDQKRKVLTLGKGKGLSRYKDLEESAADIQSRDARTRVEIERGTQTSLKIRKLKKDPQEKQEKRRIAEQQPAPREGNQRSQEGEKKPTLSRPQKQEKIGPLESGTKRGLKV